MIVKGLVIGEGVPRKGKNGKFGLEYCVEDKKGKTVSVTIWTSFCSQDPNAILPNRTYIFTGFTGDSGDFVVKSFMQRDDSEQGTDQRTQKEQMLMDSCNMRGDMDNLPPWFYTEKGDIKVKEYKAECASYQDSQERVKAIDGEATWSWIKKCWCVEYGGKWYERIYFMQMGFGVGGLNEKFREFATKCGADTGKAGYYGYHFMLDPKNRKEYEEFIVECIEEAKYFLENPPVVKGG